MKIICKYNLYLTVVRYLWHTLNNIAVRKKTLVIVVILVTLYTVFKINFFFRNDNNNTLKICNG